VRSEPPTPHRISIYQEGDLFLFCFCFLRLRKKNYGGIFYDWGTLRKKNPEPAPVIYLIYMIYMPYLLKTLAHNFLMYSTRVFHIGYDLTALYSYIGHFLMVDIFLFVVLLRTARASFQLSGGNGRYKV
jgi:hypothetical protein